MSIEYVSGAREYGEYRSRGWYVVSDETGESIGPFQSHLDAEFEAGRPDDE